MYDLVHSLRARGMSYGRIQERVSADSGCFVSKGLISEWLRGIHKPLGSVNEFDQTASFELAYVIGVVLSDGNINVRKYDREILLSVTDREYAEEFRRCLGRVVGGSSHTKVRRSDKRNRWIVQKTQHLAIPVSKETMAKPQTLDRARDKMHKRLPQSFLRR